MRAKQVSSTVLQSAYRSRQTRTVGQVTDLEAASSGDLLLAVGVFLVVFFFCYDGWLLAAVLLLSLIKSISQSGSCEAESDDDCDRSHPRTHSHVRNSTGCCRRSGGIGNRCW